jgi:hypothetical protein
LWLLIHIPSIGFGPLYLFSDSVTINTNTHPIGTLTELHLTSWTVVDNGPLAQAVFEVSSNILLHHVKIHVVHYISYIWLYTSRCKYDKLFKREE